MEKEEERVAALAEVGARSNEYLGRLGVVSTRIFAIPTPLAFENFDMADPESVLPETWSVADGWHGGFANYVSHTGVMFSTLFSMSSVVFALNSYMLRTVVFARPSQRMWYIRERSSGARRCLRSAWIFRCTG